MKLDTVIIPVAGLGTRMLPATKAIPKELLPIGDKPLIQYVVEEAIDAGIKELIFITRSGKEAIENHFDLNFELEHLLESSGKKKILKSIKKVIPEDIKITSVRQERALGLGHAILCAEHLVGDQPFAVLLPERFRGGCAFGAGSRWPRSLPRGVPGNSAIALRKSTRKVCAAAGRHRALSSAPPAPICRP